MTKREAKYVSDTKRFKNWLEDNTIQLSSLNLRQFKNQTFGGSIVYFFTKKQLYSIYVRTLNNQN